MDKYNERAEVGLDVYFYPRAVKASETSRPFVGKIRWGHAGGVADLILFPDTDGAVTCVDMVPHMSQTIDPNTGRVSGNAERRGGWEFTPWSLAYLASLEAKVKTKKKEPGLE